jgi:hypothetical protein
MLPTHRRMAAEWAAAALVTLTAGATACHGADAPRRDDCRVTDEATSNQLLVTATAFFQKAATPSIGLEPYCVVDGAPGYLLADVRTKPVEQANGTTAKYAAVCLYARSKKVWSCERLSATREIPVPGRAPVTAEWDVDAELARNTVRFLTQRPATESLRLTACGSTAVLAVSSADLLTVTRVYRAAPQSRAINAQLRDGLTISFSSPRRSQPPELNELCWLPPPSPVDD